MNKLKGESHEPLIGSKHKQKTKSYKMLTMDESPGNDYGDQLRGGRREVSVHDGKVQKGKTKAKTQNYCRKANAGIPHMPVYRATNSHLHHNRFIIG